MSNIDREKESLSIKTILHPTDFSDRSNLAFHVACSLAQAYRANLVLLYVGGPIEPLSSVSLIPTVDEAKDDLWKKLNTFSPDDPQVSVSRHIRNGQAAEEILQQAKESHADMIVMGTHGRTGLGRLLLGSVAEAVLRSAACPVVTVKLPPASE